MRDPKVNPDAGDVLYAAGGRAMVVVTRVDGEHVEYTARGIGLADAQHRIALAEWRKLAAGTATVDRSATIGDLEKRRAEIVAMHKVQLTEIDERLSFLRGDK